MLYVHKRMPWQVPFRIGQSGPSLTPQRQSDVLAQLMPVLQQQAIAVCHRASAGIRLPHERPTLPERPQGVISHQATLLAN